MRILAAFFIATFATSAVADAPVIEEVRVVRNGDTISVSVKISHPDSGWDHYADGWQVLDENGVEIGMRVLAHPHVTEQPFTRSLSGIPLADSATMISVRARCSVDGWSDETYDVPMD